MPHYTTSIISSINMDLAFRDTEGSSCWRVCRVMDTGGSPAGGREEGVEIPPHGRCSGVISCSVVRRKMLSWRKMIFGILCNVLIRQWLIYIDRFCTRAPGPIFIFMQFLGTFGRIVGWHLPLGFAPSSGIPGSASVDGDMIFWTMFS